MAIGHSARQHGLRATFAENVLRRQIDGGVAENLARDVLAAELVTRRDG